MKKYLILLFVAGSLAFTSCSGDDDDAGKPTVIATWTLVSVNPPQVYDLSACPENPTITFNQNDTTNWTVYDSENDCLAVNSSGEWRQNSDGTYTVEIPDLGTFTGNVSFNGQNEFSFTTSYNTIPVILTFRK